MKMASILGAVGFANSVAYVAAKHGVVVTLMKKLANDPRTAIRQEDPPGARAGLVEELSFSRCRDLARAHTDAQLEFFREVESAERRNRSQVAPGTTP